MKSMIIFFQIAKKSTDDNSIWKKIRKDNFNFEDSLDIFYYNSTLPCNEKKWSFKLRFSFYQEACEYVRVQQREDIDFNSNISNLKDRSQKQFNDLMATFKKPNSALDKIKEDLRSDISKLEKKMTNELNTIIDLLCKKQ